MLLPYFYQKLYWEDYTSFFRTAGRIGQNTAPMYDSEQNYISTKVQKKRNIWVIEKRYKGDIEKNVRKKSRNHIDRSMPGSYTHACKYSTLATNNIRFL